jgi:hypothetical protein
MLSASGLPRSPTLYTGIDVLKNSLTRLEFFFYLICALQTDGGVFLLVWANLNQGFLC